MSEDFEVVTDLRTICYLTYPAVTPVITSGTWERPNAMAAAWVTYVSFRPPLIAVSIAPGRYTHALIREHRCFGVCFLPHELCEKIWGVGNVSGREVDKFEKFGLTKMRPAKIKSPLIAEAYACLECTLYNEVPAGDHTLFIGEIVHVWVKRGVLKGKVLDLEKVRPALYVGEGYWVTVDPKSLKRTL